MEEGIPITAPENLNKERLKHELAKNNVSFSPNDSKEALVRLYRSDVMDRDNEPGCDLSSDEELARPHSSKKLSKHGKFVTADAYIAKVVKLTDEELLEELSKRGVAAGPILDTTRTLYQRKLAQVMAEQAKASSKLRSQAPPPAIELKGELSSQDDEEGEDEGEELEGEEEEEEEEEEEVTRVLASKQFTAATPLIASRPIPPQESVRVKVRQRHIERIITPAKPAVVDKPKKKKAACEWSFWITFLLLVVSLVVAFFAWDHYWSDDSYFTKLCVIIENRFEW